MPLKINRFPHAEYDPETRIGWLCDYYAWLTLPSSVWRQQSHSGSILDYKEGTKQSLEFFLAPYKSLIDYVLDVHDANYAYVVAVPASVPSTDPAYTRRPKSVTGRNRDDRNELFCEMLSESHDYVINANLLDRITPKPKKARWDAETHKNSMGMRQEFVDPAEDEDDLFILVDDVCTQGGTIDGAKLLLSEYFDEDRIVRLPLAHNRFAEDFRPLNP